MLNKLARYPGFFVLVVTMEIFRTRKEILFKCKPHLSKAGRWRVTVIDASGKRRIRLVHVLIWESVYGPVPVGYVIHHNNFIRTDNRLENLQLMWGPDHLRLHYYVEKKAMLDAGRKNSADCWIQSRIRNEKGRFIRDWKPELNRRLAATF